MNVKNKTVVVIFHENISGLLENRFMSKANINS
jgi:hypothetical protein